MEKEENKLIENEIPLNPSDSSEIVSLEDSTKQVVENMLNSKDQAEYKSLIDLFNLNQSKKNALRIVKLNELLGNIEDQAIKRIQETPDQMSNKDLLEYLKTIEESIDRSQKYVDKVEDKPMIQLNQQNITINDSKVNGLDRESREKVLEVVNSILKEIQENNEENIIDVEDLKENIGEPIEGDTND